MASVNKITLPCGESCGGHVCHKDETIDKIVIGSILDNLKEIVEFSKVSDGSKKGAICLNKCS